MTSKRKKILYVLSAIFIALIIFGIILAGSGEEELDFIVIAKSDVVQEVIVTGRVKPADRVDLAFEKSGKISEVLVDVGSNVKKNQELVKLDSSELNAQLLQSFAGVESASALLEQNNASLAIEQAKLDELKRGVRPEEISLAQTKLNNAKISLADANLNLTNVIGQANNDIKDDYENSKQAMQDAYSKADDAINVQVNELIDESTGFGCDLESFIFASSSLESSAKSACSIADSSLTSWKLSLDSLNSFTTEITLDNLLTQSESSLQSTRTYLDSLLAVLNGASIHSGFTEVQILAQKNKLFTARNNVNTAITGVVTQKQAIANQLIVNQSSISTAQTNVNNSNNAISQAEKELDILLAGTDSEKIQAQEAQVQRAKANISSQLAQIRRSQANVQNIRAQISKNIILAPFDGIIIKKDVNPGEIISINTPVITLISEAIFEIEADIPEADISKVKLKDVALVTLDAYSDDVIFNTTVSFIDPAETVIDGVPTYKTTFQFADQDPRIKSGMTANINISTAKKDNVLAVPQRLISIMNGRATARILVNGEVQEVNVTLGLRGSDGTIEIIDGLKEGDRLATHQGR